MKKILILIAMIFSLSHAEIAKDMTVYKNPYCGCCTNWIAQMKDKGFNIKTIVKDNFDNLKIKLGIAPKNFSCHTALIDGYVIEGHVNYTAIKRLLSEKPKDIIGLAVPGMIIGSPGMDAGNKKMPYNVLAIRKDGSTFIYEKH
ncbi:MAG: DUF411 domain-containing protein [Epsilonproteobacteria bacterium]|nr:DUF411 domain-containing protein [Campylobacterota bacterium]